MSIEAMKQEPMALTYKEVTDTMNALRRGTLEQQQAAAVMENKKLYTTPPAAQPAPVQEPVAWAGWHTSTDQMMLFKTKAEAVSWRDQYKKEFASIEGLVRPFLPAAPVQEQPVLIPASLADKQFERYYRQGYDAGIAAQPVKVWDADGYDSLMQQVEMIKTENQRLSALVRAQQITIEKLEAQHESK